MFCNCAIVSIMITMHKMSDCNCKLLYRFSFLLIVVTVYVIYLTFTTRLTPTYRIDGKVNRTFILEKLSEQLIGKLVAIQRRPCSNTTALYCGHNNRCGLGCQLHHRMACLIFSYAFEIPMIHNDRKNWTYVDPWEKFFKKIGSNCSTTSVAKLIDVDWFNLGDIRLDRGIPIPKELAQKVTQHQVNPFLWLIGEFANVVFQPNDEATELIAQFKKSLGITREDLNGTPLIGMQVRRTDKYTETKVKLDADDFMKEAIAFRKAKSIGPEEQITIFLATEDNAVITEFRSNYDSPSWKFVTGSIQTYVDENSRSSQLFEIIRDIQVLVDSDYVICTYTSNVCRLVLELRSKQSQDSNPECNVKSLDGSYAFVLSHAPIAGRINPI